MVTNQLMAGDCRMLCEEHCSYEIRCLVSHLCVMAGRRLAVGFLQIVPGVFPSGVVTDQLLPTAEIPPRSFCILLRAIYITNSCVYGRMGLIITAGPAYRWAFFLRAASQ